MTNEQFQNLIYVYTLLSIEGIGPNKILSLLTKLKNFENIFSADIARLSEANGISKNLAQRIVNLNNNQKSIKEKVEKTLNSLSHLNADLITYWDETYPDLLKRIYYPPLILFTLGNFSTNDRHSIAIVGTRQPSHYGKAQTEKFSADFASKKITVVSGLARGIDSTAHQTALKNNGRTIAVIGSGLDVVYPPENKKLFDEITENGVVISEYELGTKPDAQNFPRRNRIISGLSLGTLVIETTLSGGAMQTAAYAIDQDREVFAVPGNINSKQSEGTNTLIQRGEAKLVLNPDDVLIELKLKLKPEIGKNIPKPSVELTLFEQKLLSVLNTEPKHIDDISLTSEMSVSDCLVNLLTLEFKGLIKQLPGKLFLLC